MSNIPSLEYLAAHWREHPDRAACASLAEGLRKRGDLAGAAAVVLQGLAERPTDIPALIVLARIRQDQNDHWAAEAALRQASAADPTHPVVQRALGAKVATPEFAKDLAPDEPSEEASEEWLLPDDDAAHPSAEPLLTESLAILYHRQGHLDRAEEVYSALLARDPENAGLRLRRDQVAAAAAGRRPRPYDVALSGGRPLRGWLAALAEVTPPPPAERTGYDAFFEAAPSPAPPDDLADFAAFQSWLKGLDR
jgi:tetratricopeptide (TPR) repeat protein